MRLAVRSAPDRRELVRRRGQEIERSTPAAKRLAEIPALLGGGCLFRQGRQLRTVDEPVAPRARQQPRRDFGPA